MTEFEFLQAQRERIERERQTAQERDIIRLRAEVASLRASLGKTTGEEPIGCPIPGACCAVRLQAALTAECQKGQALRERVKAMWIDRTKKYVHERHSYDEGMSDGFGRVLSELDALGFPNPPQTPEQP